MLHAQQSAQHYGELFEVRRLPGLRMCAMLTSCVPEFTRPTYSSISFGLLPDASTRAGRAINVGT